MDFPANPPSEEELMEDKTSLARMSGFMIKFMAEKVTASTNGGMCRIGIHITH